MASRVTLLERPLDAFYFVYGVLHIFITVAIDSAGVIEHDSRPGFQKALLKVQIEENKDPLMANVPVWLYTFIGVELLFQLPVFIGGAWALHRDYKKAYIALLIYGVNASITTLACIAELAWNQEFELTGGERQKLIWIYFPTFLIPLILTVDMAARIAKWDPHGNAKRTVNKKED
ncbi:transmembrane protein 6/97 [Lipomyces kononenkoae]|uniref:Transmembrane protein 6/97 n=1 Tax=Lipomyces kononenkoae TaxID=34357 RepID=A0ACC3SVE8_LIPKO